MSACTGCYSEPCICHKLTPLDCADLRRRAEQWTHAEHVPVERDRLLALLDLAKRLKAALESAEPFINNQSRFADVVRAALAAAKEAKL